MAGLQVGRSFKSALFLTPLIFVVMFVVMVILSMTYTWGGETFWMIMSGLAGVWLIVAARTVYRNQRTLELTDDGFRIADLYGQQEYRDEQVKGVRYKSITNFANGSASSITDTIELLVSAGSGERWIPMFLQHKLNERSLLSQFARRVVKKVTDRERAALDSGGTIQGERWSWSRTELTIREKGRAPQVLQVADVTSVDVIDKHLCVWTGAELPVARLPEFTSNMHLLWTLLEEKMPKRDGPSPGLGPVLFERKTSRVMTIIVGVHGAAFALGCIGIGITAIINRDAPAGVGAGMLLICAALFQWWYSYCKRAFFRCHENGVSQRGLMSQNQLRYDEIATFTYQAMRHYHNGAYVGTHVHLHFFPTQASGDKPIKYNSTIMNADDALDRLRGHISTVMARVLYKAYAAGTPIVWTKNLRLIPGEGIEYTPSGFLGRKPPVKFDWEDVANYDLQKGVLHIWIKGESKSAVQEACSTANFFPGLAVFAMLLKDKGVAKEVGPAENAA